MERAERHDFRDLDEETATAGLLRLASGGADVSAKRMARVRAVVHGEWLASRRRRVAARRMAVGAGMLVTAAAIVLIVKLVAPRDSAAPVSGALVATSERVDGAPVLERVQGVRPVVTPMSPGTTLRAGDVVATDDASRVALRTPAGTSVRLDRQARMRLLSPTAIELVAGGVYVATTEGSSGLEVRTPMGAIQDVGTQFEVRLSDGALRVRVRTGRVDVHRGGAVIPANAGTEVTVAQAGIAMAAVLPYGPAWEWTTNVAPVFQIEGRPLSAFLEHLAREEGWVVRYENDALARAASSMRGSRSARRPASRPTPRSSSRRPCSTCRPATCARCGSTCVARMARGAAIP